MKPFGLRAQRDKDEDEEDEEDEEQEQEQEQEQEWEEGSGTTQRGGRRDFCFSTSSLWMSTSRRLSSGRRRHV